MKTFKTKENYLKFPTEKDGVVDGKIIARFQDPSFNSKLTGAIIQLEYFIEFEDLTLTDEDKASLQITGAVYNKSFIKKRIITLSKDELISFEDIFDNNEILTSVATDVLSSAYNLTFADWEEINN
jgi:hypothetical protein